MVVGEVVLRSIQVSGIALLFSALLGVPLGALMGLTRFRGHDLMIVFHLYRNGITTGGGWIVCLPHTLTQGTSKRLGSLVDSDPLYTNSHDCGPDDHCLAFDRWLYNDSRGECGPNLREQIEASGTTSLQSTFTILREARTSIYCGNCGFLDESYRK